ncbi:noncanonical pyrimidine nucleotidase, YjjG family [Romboutsia weinsteinii]|uniref:Noncanonical pyrimidine nucleotidase, YjjG family n=1 Tax=Romboutsia weinsteinii TaxID=2020949 RepID=A0A371J447_9FIRM|nr:YjjG family noncanonical pyrimidine nucleotidase [Romboutsia weinsteinii]RDY27560.1 noncanonical pyrimidine nucleotidase, YjjG family [Romboutsia weinsteinii]
MKYKVIFFDADDTLFDFKKTQDFALDKLMDSIETEFDKDYCITEYKKVNTKIWEEFEQGLISSSDLKVERFRRFAYNLGITYDANELSSMYVDFLGDGSFLYEETYEILSYLSDKYKISIITNGLADVQNRRIKKSTVSNFFDDVVISDEIKIAKPDPKIFEHALSNLNHTDKSSVLMIGDSLNSDIKGGINAGIDTCWFNLGKKINDSDFVPNYEINNLLELKDLL